MVGRLVAVRRKETTDMPIRGLALDVHGTLAGELADPGPDRSPIAVQALLEALGISVSYQAWDAVYRMAFFIDYPRRDAANWREFLAPAFARLGEPLPESARAAIIDRFAAQPPMPAAPDGVRALRAARALGLRTAAFTTIHRFCVEPLLAEIEGLLDLYYDGFEAGDAKGSRRYYLRLAARLDLLPDEILCVGDEPFGDVEMPRQVGMRALLLDRSGRQTGAGVIHSLDEVAERLTG
jgi:FMN phosphatase YigB (HAD superfamily)